MDVKIIAPIIIISFLVFMALREFWCWYFKINERLKLQKEANAILQTQKELTLRKLLHEGIITKEEVEREETKK